MKDINLIITYIDKKIVSLTEGEKIEIKQILKDVEYCNISESEGIEKISDLINVSFDCINDIINP